MPIEIPEWLKYEIKYHWEKLREWINRNPKAMVAIVGVCFLMLVLALIKISCRPRRPEVKPATKAWFYDLNTSELFADKADLDGPIDAPSGPLADGEPAGVRAYVFSYVDDPNEDEIMIGYMEKPDPNAKPFSETDIDPKTVRRRQWGYGKLICTVEDANWAPATSHKGRWIVREATRRDEQGRIAVYWPPR